MLESIMSIIGTVVIGVIGWSFQLSNKVSVIEAEYEGLQKLITTQFAEVNRRLSRIEDKL